MSKIKAYIEPTGQRNAVLVDESGVPDFWPTIYTTNSLRPSDLGLLTIKKHLESIQVLQRWAEVRGIEILERIKTADHFKQSEIDSLSTFLRLKSDELDKRIEEAGMESRVIDIKTGKHRSVWDVLGVIPRQIKPKSYNEKINRVCQYVSWLSNICSDHPVKGVTREDITSVGTEFSERLKALKAVEPSGNFAEAKSLANGNVLKILKAIDLKSSINPWEGIGIRVRNLAIIMILLETGMRSAELRNLRITDVIRGKTKSHGLQIVNRSGSLDDDRVYQPNPKTPQSQRSVPISDDAFIVLDAYITKIRSKIPNSQSSIYIFINDGQNLKHKGTPLKGISAITNDIRNLTGIDLTPHVLRHTATWKYCVNQKKKGLEWDDFVERLVLKFGWKNSKSPSLRHYAKKYINDELFERVADQQDEVSREISKSTARILKELSGE